MGKALGYNDSAVYDTTIQIDTLDAEGKIIGSSVTEKKASARNIKTK